LIGGNVSAGSAITAGTTISATGTITGGNLTTNGTITSGSTISATGSITGGNILTAGLMSATGNITSAANIAGVNLIITGGIFDAGQLDIQTTAANANIVFTPNGTGNVNLGRASASGNITAAAFYGPLVGAVSSSTTISATGNITGGNIITGGLITATGNINGGNIIGTNLTGTLLTASQTNITAVGTLTTGVWNASSISTSFTDAKVTSVAGRTGAVTIAQADVSGLTTGSTPTFAGLTVGTGSITLGSITNANGNGVGNIGAPGGFFNVVHARATSAQYADLAENYAADADYEPGTVLCFGGNNEVTISTSAADTRVAGVVSTNPSYLMNSCIEAEHVAAVALQGRVPTKVIGTVRKGDMMVSAGNGRAQACAVPVMGSVIGKSLENFDGESGIIEIVVGRI
jgi:hypothetical protein